MSVLLGFGLEMVKRKYASKLFSKYLTFNLLIKFNEIKNSRLSNKSGRKKADFLKINGFFCCLRSEISHISQAQARQNRDQLSLRDLGENAIGSGTLVATVGAFFYPLLGLVWLCMRGKLGDTKRNSCRSFDRLLNIFYVDYYPFYI